MEERCGAVYRTVPDIRRCPSIARWRQRMGEEKFFALLQESLAVGAKTGPP